MPIRTQPLTSLSRRTLIAMFELAAAGQPVHAGSLANTLGAQAAAVGAALCELDARGLVWHSRCALTMHGLALASRLALARAQNRALRPRNTTVRRYAA